MLARGPDEPEPEEEILNDPLQLNGGSRDQGEPQSGLHGDGQEEDPAVAAEQQAAEPNGDPQEPRPSLEDTIENLEALVAHLREQLQMANADNLRHYNQLQDLLQEHERLVEQHDAAQQVAGRFYMDRQWTLHQADQLQENQLRAQQQEAQLAIHQRVNRLLDRDVNTLQLQPAEAAP